MPYQASCADAWPTGNPTVRLATARASVSLMPVFQPATKWYAPSSARMIPTASSPWFPLCAYWARQPAAITRWMVPVIRRLPLSGNTVGPTKFVTSRSPGSASSVSSTADQPTHRPNRHLERAVFGAFPVQGRSFGSARFLLDAFSQLADGFTPALEAGRQASSKPFEFALHGLK